MGTLSPLPGSPLSKEANEIFPKNLKPHLCSWVTNKTFSGHFCGFDFAFFVCAVTEGMWKHAPCGAARALVTRSCSKGAPPWKRVKLWEAPPGYRHAAWDFLFIKARFNDMLCIHPLKIQPVLGIFNLGFYSYYCLIFNCFFLITSWSYIVKWTSPTGMFFFLLYYSEAAD